jgi:hypothetical protein
LQKVKDFPGLIHIERPKPNNEEFADHESARQIINHAVPLLNLYGLKTILKRRVFISYSRKDELFANQLEEALVQQGIGVWIDKNEVLVGDSLISKITEGISGSQFVCAIISSNSINSRWVQEELNLAMTRQIKSGEVMVLPLLLEPELELPSFLEEKLHIDFSRLDFQKGIEALMKRLKKNEQVFGHQPDES